MSDDQNTHHQAFYENRYKTIKALRETKNPDPYPHKFHVTHGVPKFIEEFGAEGKLKNGDVIQSAKPVGLIPSIMRQLLTRRSHLPVESRRSVIKVPS
jgi:hypothetical protein